MEAEQHKILFHELLHIVYARVPSDRWPEIRKTGLLTLMQVRRHDEGFVVSRKRYTKTMFLSSVMGDQITWTDQKDKALVFCKSEALLFQRLYSFIDTAETELQSLVSA